jgi:hypothetical protein
MIELVTTAQARSHLRLDSDSNGGADDDWLAIFIPAISEAVASWLKEEWRLYEWLEDSNGDYLEDSAGDFLPDTANVRWAVKAAVLVELERQYRYRGGESEADVPSEQGHGYTLGKGATALLSPLRKTTVA